MVHLKTAILATLGTLTSVSLSSNVTQPVPIMVNLAAGPVVGGLYKPAAVTDKASIGVFVMHAESDYLSFPPCTELQERGYTVFCAQNGVSKLQGETDVDFEPMMTGVGLGVTYLRENVSWVDTVVLFGHSGGGALMAAYQNIAENGISACNGSEKLYPCSDDLSDLPAADGVILIDANYGLSTMFLLSLGPEVIDEKNASLSNNSLSVYNVDAGFNASGVSTYTPEFTRTFQSAVAARMQRLVASAQERLAAIQAGQGIWSDDEPFYVIDGAYGIENNKFFAQDTSFLSRTRYEWPLLHANESATTQVVPTVRVPTNFGPSEENDYWSGALKTSVTRFLSGYGLTVTDDFMYNATDIVGIEWDSSHFATVQSVPGITVPTLFMGMTGHWEFLNAEKLYLASPSSDKSIAFVEGAEHTFETCTECESYPGEFGDTTKTTFDHMASWLGSSGRFVDS